MGQRRPGMSATGCSTVQRLSRSPTLMQPRSGPLAGATRPGNHDGYTDKKRRKCNILQNIRQQRYDAEGLLCSGNHDFMTLRLTRVFWVLCLAPGILGCDFADPGSPVATPVVELSRLRVPLGGPLEMNVRFAIAEDAPGFSEDYRVFLHFLDADGELMFNDDHAPPEPTTAWLPGQVVSYDRRTIVPVYPYIGEVTVVVGLYSPDTGNRLPMEGEPIGQRAYPVAKFEMASQSESGFFVYEDGWYAPESAPEEPDREWRWTSGVARLSFRNPRTDATFYLEVDGRPELFEAPQQLTVTIGEFEVGVVSLAAGEPSFHIVDIPRNRLGAEETVVLTLRVEPPFVPAELTDNENADDRELGMQVFYVFLERQL